MNDHDLAIRYYMTAIKMVYQDHPDYAWPYANLANLMLKRNENDKAFSLAMEAAKRDPNTAKNFFLIGKALRALGKPELSVRWLERSIELDLRYPEPRYMLGQIYSRLGKKEEAEEQFAKFRELRKTIPRDRR